MTRLQKKCLIAVAGTHFMLVVLVLCSGFIRPRPKPDDTQVLDVIPANIIDAAFRSGVRNAPPPAPTPPTPTVTPPQPTPPQPKPVVQPPPKPVEKPEEPKLVEHTEPKPAEIHKIDPSMVPVVRPKTQQTDDSEAKAKAEAAREAREAKRLQREKIKAIQEAASAIRDNTASSTTVELPPGQSSAAYADYASVVKTVYTENWTLPDSAASDDANVKVSVTIASDGTVTDAHIVEKSGDASVDSSVQRTLEKVTTIRPFPEGSTDKERTYIINFNLKAKRMFG
jgi:TonB family protein